MTSLFATANEEGSKEGTLAVQKLGGFRGSAATEMLIRVALSPSATMDARQAAIEALAKRRDVESSAPLASLMQPHTALRLRFAASKALLEIPCSPACALAILHYLARMERGESNYEDEELDGMTSLGRIGDIQAQTYRNLDQVMLSNRRVTLGVLADIYGLGTPAPSGFALRTVAKLGLSEACPQLKRSQQLMTEARAQQLEMSRIIAELKCN
jgi:hypothetical protein